MADSARFKLNLKTREVEIEGSEAFVEKQIQGLEAIFEFLARVEPAKSDSGDTDDGENPKKLDVLGGKTAPKVNGVPATFGEWMHSFKKDVNDLDKALITARYVQHQSPDNDFKTSEVNSALKEHGIKLSNPSTSLQRLAQKKLLFQTRKVGKLKFMRVSTEGQDLLETLKA